MRALRVTVSSTVLSTSLVGGELGQTTVLVHLGEVECTVETAREVGHVNVEGELLVQELEHLVCSVGLHEVDTRADVGASLELESQGIAAGGDTVCAGVVSTVDRAVLSAGRRVWAKSGVPGVTGVAVSVTGGSVEPTPVGVEHNSGILVGAAGFCAGLRRKLGVDLSHLSADLLAVDGSDEGEGDERGFGEHFCA